MAACVPAELGGIGVESLHDAILGINRLGQGDGSTAIATAMHVLATWVLTRPGELRPTPETRRR
jgi:alkylation response protein AidB-like acyl-CoA dehydrogenase